jgi:hypothetical protein
MQYIASSLVDPELQFIAGIGIARALHPHVADRLDLILKNAVGGLIGIDGGLAALNLDIPFKNNFPIRPSAHPFRADGGRRVLFIRLATLCRSLRRRKRGHRGRRDDRGQDTK